VEKHSKYQKITEIQSKIGPQKSLPGPDKLPNKSTKQTPKKQKELYHN
jgi:hypothetical protein